ncbi:hypothetical protein NQ315_005493 [Exocentrus adspersus]|uniref:Uncharacterized protein n=1 Tax=Exocentrus adspersus TaxID=1586481 RepID=A0AAV8VST9_9CUCU|nr:hypothetical protein NQ315_005493 [Exocentrus adspersus]
MTFPPIVICVLIIVPSSHTKSSSVNTMSKAWIAKEVVPDVVDAAPAEKLAVKYPQIAVNEGNVVKPSQVKDPPQVSWPAEDNALYTICMTDPDAPSRKKPSAREWHHWLVVNVPGSSVEKGVGDVLSEYVGAGPPKGTGLHRYIILVYKQQGKINPDEKKLTNKQGQGRGKIQHKKILGEI